LIWHHWWDYFLIAVLLVRANELEGFKLAACWKCTGDFGARGADALALDAAAEDVYTSLDWLSESLVARCMPLPECDPIVCLSLSLAHSR
jgi:hypothetical protein